MDGALDFDDVVLGCLLRAGDGGGGRALGVESCGGEEGERGGEGGEGEGGEGREWGRGGAVRRANFLEGQSDRSFSRKNLEFGSLHVTETLFRNRSENEDEGEWKRETKMRCLRM